MTPGSGSSRSRLATACRTSLCVSERLRPAVSASLALVVVSVGEKELANLKRDMACRLVRLVGWGGMAG
jgi:hypothetical protein